MALDPAQKKVARSAIDDGLYVLTAAEDGDDGAGGVNSVTQASFDPGACAAEKTPLVLRSTGLHCSG